MSAYAAVLAMVTIAMPSLSLHEREMDARAVVAALSELNGDWRPAPELVVAVMWRESRGMAHVCGEDRFGGSARGLMGIRRAGTRCTTMPHDSLYEPLANARAGVRILVQMHAFEHARHHDRHDFLDHYAGARSPSRYALEVRAMETNLRRKRL